MSDKQFNMEVISRFELVDMRTYATVAVVEARGYAEALARAHTLEDAGFVTGVAVSVNPLGGKAWHTIPTFYDGFFEDKSMLH